MRVLNIAHRGARSLAPENTLAAARKAREIGADLWETDVAATAGGELLLFHDDTLVRTTNAQTIYPDRSPWTTTTFTLAEIRALDAGSWFVETDPFGQIAAGAVTPGQLLSYVCESVPTLREALIFTQEANWRVNLELKRVPAVDFPLVQRVTALVEELRIETHRIIISSYDHEQLRQVQRLNPEIEVQAVVVNLRGVEDDPEFETYNVWTDTVSQEEVRVLCERGIAVNLFTVNEEGDMRRFIAAGAAGLFTDFPQRLKAVLQD